MRETKNTNYVNAVSFHLDLENNKIKDSINYFNLYYTDYKNYSYYTNFEISF
ncbi:MAG: hypothetical protein ACP5QP_01845 [Brevinematia bacterium]